MDMRYAINFFLIFSNFLGRGDSDGSLYQDIKKFEHVVRGFNPLLRDHLESGFRGEIFQHQIYDIAISKYRPASYITHTPRMSCRVEGFTGVERTFTDYFESQASAYSFYGDKREDDSIQILWYSEQKGSRIQTQKEGDNQT